MLSNAHMTSLLISYLLIICRSTTKFWLDFQWLPQPILRMVKECLSQSSNIAKLILRKRSNFTVQLTKRCSVLSVSSSIPNRSTRLSIALLKVSFLPEYKFILLSWPLRHQKQFKFSNFVLNLVVDMKRMVQEMINEVEVYESETPASEELYSKLELKVRKKFNDEIDRLEKSFRRIMEQLEIQQ